ncbi:MAG: hypothetical protein Q9220_001772 [cf. Caloplaca sp. 1 TL-2023]
MFRKPREAAPVMPDSTLVRLSTGRPPTPPHTKASGMDLKPEPVQTSVINAPIPLLGRTKTTPRANSKTIINPGGRSSGKSNSSILSFFKRADTLPAKAKSNEEEEGLFLGDGSLDMEPVGPTQTPTPPRDHDIETDIVTQDDSHRYNETNGSVKRQRLSEDLQHNTLPVAAACVGRGPFVDASDSEDDEILPTKPNPEEPMNNINVKEELLDSPSRMESAPMDSHATTSSVPTLKREPTSHADGDDFNDMDDLVDDEYLEGEEYMERRWMQEQADLETGLEEENADVSTEEQQIDRGAEESASCPICQGSFGSMSEEETSKHVNDCLDGRALPLQAKKEIKAEIPNAKRFQRAAIARPGQENPFDLAGSISGGSSAFSKLMSGHAEDAAWATAAATEVSSRGKPAYQRTCPFYKILPGFSICVDAFRYGAVEGCQAYFLSHFHSDHYIGLTSSWCHGPIYCSHVTANLVRRQLRVDPKWVVDLEFDETVEVPGTQGVTVTMIPANHCPGSSLYLYEKAIGKGKNPKVQRILHCGDFRACPAHVQHPLLRPDVVDRVTGRNTAQQKLDVCYLDTTYLTPKYAFPSQEEVIKACADMCVSLSKEKVDETDDWEQTKKERAGSGMVKFVKKEPDIKEEMEESKGKRRGRLLVIVGTYSIGKERICLGVAKALNSKIYATPQKQKICAALEDPELMGRLTSDPLEAQVHMQMLMEIRAETLADYLTGYKPHFSRIVGFRPSGWNYRPPNSRFVESPSVQTVLHSDNWKSRYSMAELVPQRGSTREASCFGVPYSEHSSFRELSMFCCALRIDKIIPTVNVGSAKSREKMKGWCEKWAMEKKKNGLFKVADGQLAWS